ncbi:murein biosynthesis integral membrane protein MurJ [Aristophania vespae]|uniref:Probable lipid II flippase MurJ n=1 Tax=Aristophania vespae TaxID=2697033 RepID=A0A6P1NFS7_9PROT|nr:murein biosynthesis integral membrane protein MurJ [Aristophania vespae]QHI95380.1 murein biosynthesis integral membrane protein MurJ [Aristophania vespae]UMM64656.1 putative lipid II flippase MurJ [Aristophania vespae]
MLRNLLTVGGWTMLSRLLGLVRDQLLAIFLGAGPLQDAYQIAFRLPNMFRRLLGEGAFNAAFLPLFAARYEQKGASNALKFAGQALTCLLTLLVIFATICEIFMPWVISFIAPGFKHGSSERFMLAVSLTRVTMPYMVFICAAALIAGILNARRHFGAAAAAYVTFNIVGISAIIFGAYVTHNVALSSAWGITISGVVQLGALCWAAKKFNLLPHFAFPHFTPDIKILFKRMIPGLVGSGVTQLNLAIDTIIGTLLPTGSISWLYFADRVNQLPLGVLGSALGTTLLPLLTKHVVANDKTGMQASINKAFDYALILILPASFGLIALAPLIMGGLFGYGHFTQKDIIYSAQSLQAFAIGLPAFVLIKLLAPAFFAQGDTATPVKIGFVTLALNLILNLLLYRPLAHIGPPLASALAGFTNLVIMGIILWRKDILLLTIYNIKRVGKISAACIIMAVTIHLTYKFTLSGALTWSPVPRIFSLFILIIGGAIFYGVLLIGFKLLNLKDIKAILKRRLSKN